LSWGQNADAVPAALAEALPSAAEIESGIGLKEEGSDDDTHGPVTN
jgi:hypothetical protein